MSLTDVDRGESVRPSPFPQPSGSISIYAGKLMHCRNMNLFVYLADKLSQATLASQIRNVVGKHFQVLGVFFVNYGSDSGPGIWVPLAESSLLLGAWPEKKFTIDFLLHYCGENHDAAKACARSLKEFAGAKEMCLSPLTLQPRPLLQV